MLSNKELEILNTQFNNIFREPSKYEIYTVDPTGKKTILATVTTYQEVRSFLIKHAEQYPKHNSPVVQHIFDVAKAT